MEVGSGLEVIRRELALAEQARREGREGRARVCARRAAGWSIAPFFARVTGRPPSRNAIQLLHWYRDCPEAPPELRSAAARLTVPVGNDHRLPHAEDPLEDARRLVRHLTGSPESNLP